MLTESRENTAGIVIENMKTRSSCRLYTDEPVTRETVEVLLEAANYAPCPKNCQPWEFIVLTGEPLQAFRAVVSEWLQSPEKNDQSENAAGLNEIPAEEFFPSLPKHLAERQRGYLTNLSAQLVQLGTSLKETYNFTFYCHNAPVVIMVVGDAVRRDRRHGLEIHQALAAAMQNILLGANAMGLGACWIGDIMLFGKRLHEHLAIGGMKEVVGAITIGHPVQGLLKRPAKQPLDGKVSWRGFQSGH